MLSKLLSFLFSAIIPRDRYDIRDLKWYLKIVKN